MVLKAFKRNLFNIEEKYWREILKRNIEEKYWREIIK
jgi:intein-encoded DNA endonuclease-like protein